MQHIKSILIFTISIVLLISLARWFDIETVFQSLSGIRFSTIVLTALLLSISYFLGFLRYYFLLTCRKNHPSLKQALYSYAVGHIGNLFFFNIVGQSYARILPLQNNKSHAENVVILTFYERLISLITLSMFTIIALFIISPKLDVELTQDFSFFLFTFISLVIVALSTLLLCFPARVILYVLKDAWKFLQENYFSIIVTVFIQLFMFLAYLVLIVNLTKVQLSLELMSALIIVMFCASLPISFAGWGVRELSAAYCLALIGVESHIGVSLGVAIGLISQILVYTYAVSLSVFCKERNDNAIVRITQSTDTNDTYQLKNIKFFVIFSISILIYFQVWIPTEESFFTVNLADLSALFCLVFYATSNRRKIQSVPILLTVFIASISLFLMYSIIIGYTRYGPVNWALTNRGLGWLIIMGYLLSGQLLSPKTVEARNMVLKAFVYACTLICVIQIIVHITDVFFDVFSNTIVPVYFLGYAANPNAYAFQLLVSFIVCIVVGRDKNSCLSERFLTISMLLIVVNIYFSDSRAILLLLFMSILFPLRMKSSKPERKRFVAVFTVFLLMSIISSPVFLNGVSSIVNSFYDDNNTKQLSFMDHAGDKEADARSDTERWASIQDGIRLWQDNKVFGAGLGANIYNQIEGNEQIVVIHSVPIWLLGEAGIVGLALFLIPILLIARKASSLITHPDYGHFAIGIIILVFVFLVGGLAHDFFYQRTFWFVLGLLLFNPNGQYFSWRLANRG